VCVAVGRIVVGGRCLGVGWWLGGVCVWYWGGGYVAQVDYCYCCHTKQCARCRPQTENILVCISVKHNEKAIALDNKSYICYIRLYPTRGICLLLSPASKTAVCLYGGLWPPESRPLSWLYAYLDPLFLPSGEQLPRLHAGDSYKHMGIQQRMNGDTAAAATAFLNRGKAAVARLGQLSLPVRARVRAGNIVMGGVCGYYGSASAVSRAECETVEAVWRAHLARFAGRA